MKENELFKPDKNKVIIEYLERFNLPPAVKVFMDSLVEGKVPESMLICCNSGCTICQQTIYDCFQEIKRELDLKI